MLARIKFDIGTLVNEMLDGLPAEMWTSKTTTFLDPAMGGGQFVAEVERRLLAHGHSKSNVAKRVFGLAEYPHHLPYAISTHKLIGTYSVASFTEEKFNNMKFNVMVGNPPFQNKQENSDSAFWLKFVNKGMNLLADDGKLCFVSPRSWVGKVTNTSKADFTPFTDNHVELYKPLSENEKKKYFDGVGSSFGYYIISKGQGLTEIVFEDGTSVDHQLIKGEPLPNLINKLSFSIHKKIANATKFDFKSNFKFHSQVLKKKGIVADTKSAKFPNTTYYSHNLIRYTTTQQDIYSDNKVMIPNVGRLSNAWVDSDCNLTEDVRFAIVKNKTQGDRMVKLLKSPLYSYIGAQYRSGRNLGKAIDFLPELDLAQSWTNEDVYKHFKLTKQEIEYVESHTE